MSCSVAYDFLTIILQVSLKKVFYYVILRLGPLKSDEDKNK